MNALSMVEHRRAGFPASEDDGPLFEPDRRSAPRNVTIRELLVWTYREQQAHRILRHLHRWFEFAVAISGLAGDDAPRPQLDPDAALVHGTVMETLRPEQATLIIDYASRGDEPEGSYVRPEPFPAAVDRHKDFWRRGKYRGAMIDYKVIVVDRVTERIHVYRRDPKSHRKQLVEVKDVVTDVLACPIDWFPDASWSTAINGIVDEWNAAMTALEPHLRALTLKRHILID
jgi:hypothetical protein